MENFTCSTSRFGGDCCNQALSLIDRPSRGIAFPLNAEYPVKPSGAYAARPPTSALVWTGTIHSGMRFVTVCCFFLILSEACAQSATDLNSLYRQHRWFELRNAISESDASPFYRGAVECAFGELLKCEADLHEVAKSHSTTADRIAAHRILISAFFREGKYKAALSEADALLALDPDDADIKSDHPLLQILGEFSDQQAESHGNSVLKIDEHGLPVVINGKSATYWFDTGANLSVLSESEARRLNLVPRSVQTTVGVMTGAKVGFRIALAESLQIGNSTLKNVVFLVFPDEQQPFSSLPQESRGLLGMPVLLVLGQISFGSDRQFEIISKENGNSLVRPNLCFDGKTPLALVEYKNRQLTFTLDTGASSTDLYPPFAIAFPEVLRRGQTRVSKMEGVGSTQNLESAVLPSVKLKVDHFPLVLRPATVLLKENGESSRFFHGNLGIDLLMQPRKVVLDFRTMRLSAGARKK